MIRYIIHVVSNYTPQSLLWHLSRVRGNVFEGPLNVLVAGEGAAEAGVGGAAEPQQAVVGRQHRPVEVDHVGVLVVRQDVVEGDVFDDMRVVENKFDVLRTIETSMVPELEESLYNKPYFMLYMLCCVFLFSGVVKCPKKVLKFHNHNSPACSGVREYLALTISGEIAARGQ